MAVLLYPFIPESAQKIWQQLGMNDKVSQRKWESISKLEVESNHLIGSPSPLFAKVEQSEIEDHKKRLGKMSGN